MQHLATLLSVLIIGVASLVSGAQLHRAIRFAAPDDSLTVKKQAEGIVVSALAESTTSAPVDIPTEAFFSNIEEVTSASSEENKNATSVSPSKEPALFEGPASQRTTTRPSLLAPTTKKHRRTTTTRRPRPDIDANAPVNCNSGIEFWPHTYCNKYVWCIDGKKTVHTCNDGLYWNYKLERCGWPKRVPKNHCKIPPIVVAAITTSTTTTPVPYRDCSQNEFHSHPECDKYIRCVNGEPQTFQCPGKLYWDNENEICEWPRNVSHDNCKAPPKKNT